jgi:hypothetical protein
MGDCERAERYHNTNRIYSSLERIAQHKEHYQTSLNYHEKALEYLKKSSIYNEQENIGRRYVDIGASDKRPTIHRVLPFKVYLINKCEIDDSDDEGIKRVKSFLGMKLKNNERKSFSILLLFTI